MRIESGVIIVSDTSKFRTDSIRIELYWVNLAFNNSCVNDGLKHRDIPCFHRRKIHSPPPLNPFHLSVHAASQRGRQDLLALTLPVIRTLVILCRPMGGAESRTAAAGEIGKGQLLLTASSNASCLRFLWLLQLFCLRRLF